jgi:dinuclear metal center YbgI/SA1388 family protein
MTTARLHQITQRLFPPAAAWKQDRIGIQIDRFPADEPLRKILISYEITPEVVREAIQNDCQCICAFHPLIFSPLYSISQDDSTSATVHALIRANISALIIHTNFDAHPAGTNVLAAQALGIVPESISMLVPDAELPGFGMGIFGSLPDSMAIDDFLAQAARVFKSPLRYVKGRTQHIKTISMVCGSGSSYFNHALQSGADCFITADVKYHQFREAAGKIALIDPGHAEMERFVAQGLHSLLKQESELHTLDIVLSSLWTSPVEYLTNF